ncbi:MAG: penicillin-binding protein activator [SAR324 cluster bacterium]|nr:penicillin-binding protein activator [SAR324 cluster bacterium]
MKKTATLLLICFLLGQAGFASSFLSNHSEGDKGRLLGSYDVNLGFGSFFGDSANKPGTVATLNGKVLKKLRFLVKKRSYTKALAIMSRLPKIKELNGDSSSVEKEEYHYLLIQTYFGLGQNAQTTSLARSFIGEYPSSNFFAEVYYDFAVALVNLNLPLEETEKVSNNTFHALSVVKGARLRDLTVEDALNKGQVQAALGFMEEEKGVLASGYQKWMPTAIEKLKTVDQVEDLIDRYEIKKVKSLGYVKKIRLYVAESQQVKAKELVQDLLARDDLSPKTYAELKSLAAFLDNEQNNAPQKIGVILPFSHWRFKGLADQVLQGLEVALKNHKLKGKPFELVIRDSGLNQKKSRKKVLEAKSLQQQSEAKIKDIVRELAVEERVVAIIGPLSKNASIFAGEAAQKYRIPLISLSMTEGLAENNKFLFRFQKATLQESKIIARYAVDYLGAKRFLIFYPVGKRGFAQMQVFKNEVESLGGTIVGIAQVKRKGHDFQKSFKAMTGGYQRITGQDVREINQTRDRMEPQVDFDAIYAPLKPEQVNIVASFTNLFDASGAWILAGSEVNAKEARLIEEQKRVRFVDGNPTLVYEGKMAGFIESHWSSFNYQAHYRPPTNYSLYGYETLQLLAQLLQQKKNQSSEGLQQALRNMKSVKVLSGEVSYLEPGELIKDLKVYKFKNYQAEEIF